ncbi:unnamed protein product [Oikopleura dioica]|uniref:Uncharacterized protein n=1 Tax=Oikopleura dioica TaxID=34765 RepID=E4YG98_OIKDI|nr:unnamed protein product [Oikopleura dioica]
MVGLLLQLEKSPSKPAIIFKFSHHVHVRKTHERALCSNP